LLSTNASITFEDLDEDFEVLFSLGKSTTSIISDFYSEYSLLVSFEFLKVRCVVFLIFLRHFNIPHDFFEGVTDESFFEEVF
jgi:hypothetical protein